MHDHAQYFIHTCTCASWICPLYMHHSMHWIGSLYGVPILTLTPLSNHLPYALLTCSDFVLLFSAHTNTRAHRHPCTQTHVHTDTRAHTHTHTQTDCYTLTWRNISTLIIHTFLSLNTCILDLIHRTAHEATDLQSLSCDMTTLHIAKLQRVHCMHVGKENR